MSTTIYAGDVAFEITFPMAVVSMSGATVTSARLMVTRPDGTSDEWPCAVTSASSSSVTARHVTDGTTNAQPGEYVVAAHFYNADGDKVGASLDRRLNVTVRRTPQPT